MKLPAYSFLIPASLLLGLAPFVPEPHLVEKMRWLFTGHAFRPIDVFDLFLHGAFPALLLAKAGRDMVAKGRRASDRGRPETGKGKADDGEGGGPGGGEGSSGPPKTRAQRRREARGKKEG